MPPSVVVPFVLDAPQLAARASQALGLSNAALAEVAGCSVRTVSRWWAKESSPAYTVFQALARVAFATQPTLAAELATAGGVTLEQLGLAPPPAAQPPPTVVRPAAAAAPVSTRLLTEAVVCSAAEELDAPPRAVRGILRAAFRRAREMGLTVEAVDDALSPPPEAPAPAARPARSAGGAKEAKARS